MVPGSLDWLLAIIYQSIGTICIWPTGTRYVFPPSVQWMMVGNGDCVYGEGNVEVSSEPQHTGKYYQSMFRQKDYQRS